MRREKLKSAFYKYTDFTTLQGIGMSWINQVQGWFPVGSWMASAAAYQILLWGLRDTHLIIFGIPIWMLGNIPIWAIIIYLAVKFYIRLFFNWIVGKFVIKIGLYRAQSQYGAKKEKLNPVQVETIRQFQEHTKVINAIAEKIGVEVKAENTFTDL